MGKLVPMDAIVDTRKICNVLANAGSTLEKRLHIHVHATEESHELGELRYLGRAFGSQNITDGMSKGLVRDKIPYPRMIDCRSR